MNPHTMRDGNVLLYQRNGYVRRNWYARFRLPGEKRYIVRCSKTQNFTEAEIWAKEFYDELRFKQKHDLPIYTNSFHAVAKIAEKELAIAIENGRAHGQTEQPLDL